jgi:hypothetical protein
MEAKVAHENTPPKESHQKARQQLAIEVKSR